MYLDFYVLFIASVGLFAIPLIGNYTLSASAAYYLYLSGRKRAHKTEAEKKEKADASLDAMLATDDTAWMATTMAPLMAQWLLGAVYFLQYALMVSGFVWFAWANRDANPVDRAEGLFDASMICLIIAAIAWSLAHWTFRIGKGTLWVGLFMVWLLVSFALSLTAVVLAFILGYVGPAVLLLIGSVVTLFFLYTSIVLLWDNNALRNADAYWQTHQTEVQSSYAQHVAPFGLGANGATSSITAITPTFLGRTKARLAAKKLAY